MLVFNNQQFNFIERKQYFLRIKQIILNLLHSLLWLIVFDFLCFFKFATGLSFSIVIVMSSAGTTAIKRKCLMSSSKTSLNFYNININFWGLNRLF